MLRLRPGFLLLIAGICGLVSACKKEDPKPCNYLPAGAGLEFRIVDTAGKDVLFATHDSLAAMQPCRTTPLVPVLTAYRIPATADTGIVISFGNLRTPIYGESGECYRIFFNWSNGDEDTVDWHYRVEEVNGCDLQILDYISFNGLQALKKTDYSHEYYRLTKY